MRKTASRAQTERLLRGHVVREIFSENKNLCLSSIFKLPLIKKSINDSFHFSKFFKDKNKNTQNTKYEGMERREQGNMREWRGGKGKYGNGEEGKGKYEGTGK